MLVNKFDVDWMIISSKAQLGIDVKKDIETLAEMGHPIACASFFNFVRERLIDHSNSKIEEIVDSFDENSLNYEEHWAKYRKEFVCNYNNIIKFKKYMSNGDENFIAANIKCLIGSHKLKKGCPAYYYYLKCLKTNKKAYEYYQKTGLNPESILMRKMEFIFSATKDFPGYTYCVIGHEIRRELLNTLKEAYKENPEDIRIAFDYASHLSGCENFFEGEKAEKAKHLSNEIFTKIIKNCKHSQEFLDCKNNVNNFER